VDWSKIPDLGAVALLACAFASVARRSQTPVSGLWLTGWLMIVLHFAAFLFAPLPGTLGLGAVIIGLCALTWAGCLFMEASVPYREEASTHSMSLILVVTNTLYITLILIPQTPALTLDVAAALFGLAPLTFTLIEMRKFQSLLRWSTTVMYCALAVFLLAVQHRPGNGSDLALNAVLFTVYFGCSINFIYGNRRATTGAFITFAGFLAWAAVFLVSPFLAELWPSLHVESEVWNLPKYVVAVGMILLLLEAQIEHNKVLALHDELTGLANRRLFHDRLASVLERAHRNRSQTALLLVDLDRFKQVNDTLGHHIGDLLLHAVGQIFAGRVRRTDTVARTGGDEFSIILEEPITRADAEHVADSLLQLLNKPIQLGGNLVQIGASVGVAVFPEDASTMEGLCIAADLRMYEQKQDSGQQKAIEKPNAPRLEVYKDRELRPGLQISQ